MGGWQITQLPNGAPVPPQDLKGEEECDFE